MLRYLLLGLSLPDDVLRSSRSKVDQKKRFKSPQLILRSEKSLFFFLAGTLPSNYEWKSVQRNSTIVFQTLLSCNEQLVKTFFFIKG